MFLMKETTQDRFELKQDAVRLYSIEHQAYKSLSNNQEMGKPERIMPEYAYTRARKAISST